MTDELKVKVVLKMINAFWLGAEEIDVKEALTLLESIEAVLKYKEEAPVIKAEESK